MALSDKLAGFCRFFHNVPFPQIRLYTPSERYVVTLFKKYNISQEDINKTSTLILILTFSIASIIVWSILKEYNIILFLLFFLSFLFSVGIGYIINRIAYSTIKREESLINVQLHLIKLNYLLIQQSSRINSNNILNFIELIIEMKIPISKEFKYILGKIHEGISPESLLRNYISPSRDFNSYIKELLTNNFNQNDEINLRDNSQEQRFKIYLKSIESKLNIFFFMGLFLPIGVCAVIITLKISKEFLILYLILFLILLNFIYKLFLKPNIMLLGVLKERSKKNKAKFEEFILFLTSFAINLITFSPERAIVQSFLDNRKNYYTLKNHFEKAISNLISLKYSFNDVIQSLKFELDSIQYSLILDAINKMTKKSAYNAHRKIGAIIKILNRHHELENELDTILESQRTRIYLFIPLIPVVLGILAGIIPIFTAILQLYDYNSGLFEIDFTYSSNIFTLIDPLRLSIIFLILLISGIISSYHFLKIIDIKQKIIFFILICEILTFIICFFIAFSILTNFFVISS